MMKVLLVDDEPIILKGLRCLIEWEKYGYEICGTATSALKALELADEINPDLIITDLVMPEMDGIECIQKLISKNRNFKIIILSGYGEFQYAKKALEYSVFDYLLKPVTREQLVESICKAKEAIESEHSNQVYIEEIKQKLRESLPLLRDKFLLDVLKGRIKNEEEILKRADNLEIQFLGDQYLVLAIEVEWDDSNTQFGGINEDYLMRFAVSNVASEVLERSFLNQTFLDGSMLYSILILRNDFITTEKLFDTLNELKDNLKQYINVKLTIGVGKKYSAAMNIHMSAKEAKEALKNKFLMGKEAIIFASSVLTLDGTRNGYSIEEEKRVIETIKYGHDVQVQQLANHLVDQFVEGSGKDIDQVYEYCFEFCSQLKRNLVTNEQSPSGISSMWQIAQCKTAGELKTCLSSIISQAYESINNQRQLKEYDVTEQAKEYIQNNYSKDVTLKSVANIVYMSPTYFSALFKKKTNENFQDYLTRIRMDAARELLKDSSYKTYEVSYMVGYSNARYFSDVFKKYYGVTPSEYKEEVIGNAI